MNSIDYIKPEIITPYEIIKLELEREELEDIVNKYFTYKWITEDKYNTFYKPKFQDIDDKINKLIHTHMMALHGNKWNTLKLNKIWCLLPLLLMLYKIERQIKQDIIIKNYKNFSF